MNSLEIHQALNDLNYLRTEKDLAYAFGHQVAKNTYLYVKKNNDVDRVFDDWCLVIHPENFQRREELESIDGLAFNWNPRKSNSYKEFPKFGGVGTKYGHEVSVRNLSALKKLIAVLTTSDLTLTSKENSEINPNMRESTPLNQIIYGPPGTGKTYSTTAEAVKLADPDWFKETESSASDQHEWRALLKGKYDDLINQSRIAFTTFHQSFSYEDFVEGIRALTDEDKGTISYEVVDGIFKRLCTSALVKSHKNGNDAVNLENRNIWKLSLGDSKGNEGHIYDECIANNYVLMNWGEEIDFSGLETKDAIKQHLDMHQKDPQDKNDYEAGTLNRFINVMKKGDLIIVPDGNSKFRAIAEVVGDYEYLSTDEREGYQQLRRVNWLSHYSPSLPRERLFKKSLSKQAFYSLGSDTIDLSKLKVLLTSAPATEGECLPHVLIIDEINRGNLSRIFGELITLIETDKRQGGEDQRTVILPYSKEAFSVPDNLYILGTMNTADKSLAQLDLALRRRFEFIELLPQPELLSDLTVFGVKVSDILSIMNQRIEVLLDRDHAIGHSHFWPLKKLDSQAERENLIGTIFRKRIIPLLQEYFFADWERISWVLNDLEKPASSRFIQLENTGLSISKLFSSAVAEEINDRRYLINEQAFSDPESFRRILPFNEAQE